MILILNDTAHCWENETSVAASPFECPCEFIKSTSFPRSNSDLHSCTSLKEYSRTKVFNVEQNAVSISLFDFTVHDNEPHQIFIMWKEIISYYTFLISRHFYCADSTRSGRKRRNVMLCRLLSEPDVAFQGIWHRSYPSERPRCPAEKIFAVFLKINALLKWLFFFSFFPQLTLNALTFQWNQESDGRRRRSDKRVDGNSSLSLSSHPLNEKKKNPHVQPT